MRQWQTRQRLLRHFLGRPGQVQGASSSRTTKLSLSRNAVIAAETRAILDLNHDFMLKQMVGTKLDVAKLAASGQSAASPPLPPAPAARSADAAARPPGA
jgi:hypothetical protein